MPSTMHAHEELAVEREIPSRDVAVTVQYSSATSTGAPSRYAVHDRIWPTTVPAGNVPQATVDVMGRRRRLDPVADLVDLQPEHVGGGSERLLVLHRDRTEHRRVDGDLLGRACPCP